MTAENRMEKVAEPAWYVHTDLMKQGIPFEVGWKLLTPTIIAEGYDEMVRQRVYDGRKGVPNWYDAANRLLEKICNAGLEVEYNQLRERLTKP